MCSRKRWKRVREKRCRRILRSGKPMVEVSKVSEVLDSDGKGARDVRRIKRDS